MPERPLCGECPACLARTARLLRTSPSLRPQGPAPTSAALEKHARRFGPDQVAETAAELGVECVKVERAKRKRAARGPSLKERVRGHVEAGHSLELIAELEDLTPGRARRLVEEVSA